MSRFLKQKPVLRLNIQSAMSSAPRKLLKVALVQTTDLESFRKRIKEDVSVVILIDQRWSYL